MSPWRRFLLSSFIVGVLKYPLLLAGSKIFHYSRWNARPINRKAYAMHIIETIEHLIADGRIGDGYIVEVGCGMGDIIGNIRYGKKIGIDIDEHVIRAAKIWHKNVDFYIGGVDALPVSNIDVLIVVNWLHGVTPEMAYSMFRTYITKTKFFVIDLVTEIDGGKSIKESLYTHDVRHLSGNIFKKIATSPDYPVQFVAHGRMKRHIEYWERKMSENSSLPIW